MWQSWRHSGDGSTRREETCGCGGAGVVGGAGGGCGAGAGGFDSVSFAC